MKKEVLSSGNEMSQSRRSLLEKIQEQDSQIQILKRDLDQLQDKLKAKDVNVSGKLVRLLQKKVLTAYVNRDMLS